MMNGGRGGNRTHNHRLRRPVLYPIELLAHFPLCPDESIVPERAEIGPGMPIDREWQIRKGHSGVLSVMTTSLLWRATSVRL
jgi:hypothetical protein